jgi:hypothetical protein
MPLVCAEQSRSFVDRRAVAVSCHAAILVQTVKHAQQDIGLPDGVTDSIVIGARIGLWEEYLLDRFAPHASGQSDGFDPR